MAEKGAILNNGRKASQTQLAGWVQGNPNLAAGEAEIILNEVNSSNPSRLKGYVEVSIPTLLEKIHRNLKPHSKDRMVKQHQIVKVQNN